MQRLLSGMACVLLLWRFCASAAEPNPPPAAALHHVPDHVLVQFKPEAKAMVAGLAVGPALDRLAQELRLPAGAVLKEPALTRWLKARRIRAEGREGIDLDSLPADLDRFHYLQLPPGLTVEQCLAQWRDHPLLDYIEADGLGNGGDLIPSDPSFSLQWHHRNTLRPGADIATPKAWDLSTGSVAVTVAVLDTGLAATLPEFTGRVVPGYDFVNNDNDPTDDNGHGTAVAGTLAANANNALLGAGVDWACRLMPIKVLDAGNSGSYSDWAQGIDFAVANGAKVINLSAGGGTTGTTLTRAIDNAIAQGTIFVTITHNDSAGTIRFPGSLPQSITVGATTQSDTRASFSNWGPQIDLVAPGQAIYTVNRTGTFGSWNGTSFAAPLVAGVCSLMAALRPNINQADAQLYLTLGAEDGVGGAEDTPGFDIFFGWGRLNAFRSLSQLEEQPAALSILQAGSSDPASVGCALVYTMTVLNNSLTAATGVRVTNTLPATVLFTSAESSQGAHVLDGQWLVFDLGTLPARGEATMTVRVTVGEEGMLINVAEVVADHVEFDPLQHRSEGLTLAVVDDTGPTLVAAAALPDGRTVRLTFSEALEVSAAAQVAHYNVTDGQMNELAIQGVRMTEGPATVLLDVALLGSLAPFTVRVQDLQDCAGNPVNSPAQADIALPLFRLVAAGSDWKYLDDGSNQSVVWREPMFIDASWMSGPAQLGYGDNDEATVVSFGPDPDNKFITTYFRRTFEVLDTNVLTNVTMRLLRDDGAVVYLNGQEVFRSNMPGGAPLFNTLAASSLSEPEELTFLEMPIPRDKLVAGCNVVAVEIHQADVSSSDLSFDFELTTQLMAYTRPPVFIAHPEGVTAVEGDTVRFQVEVSGTPPFGYRWRRGSSTVANFGATGADFILNNVQPEQAGRYTVVVTNSANLSPGVLSQPAQLTVLADTDGDHVPDAWESAYGLDIEDPADGGQDLDGDLYSNLEEYWAGTDPRDGEDYLKIDEIVLEENGISFTFEAASNRTYSVLYLPGEAPGLWNKLGDVAARPTNRVVRIEDVPTAKGTRFYRLVAPRTW